MTDVNETPASEAAPETTPSAPEQSTKEQPPAAPDPAELERQRAIAAATHAEKLRREREIEVRRLSAAVQERDELLSLLSKDPVAFFERSGVDFNKVAKAVLDGQRPSPVDKIAEKVSALERSLEEQRAREREAYYQSLEEQAARDIEVFLKQNSSTYEFAAASDEAVDLVLDALEAHYNETGQIDMAYAASKVEAYLESLAQKFSKAQKIAKFVPTQTGATGGAQSSAVPGKTLTNAVASTAPTRDVGNTNGPLSREESVARAARLLKFGTTD